MKQIHQSVIITSALSIFCLLLYFNSLWGIFVFDDAHSIVNNLYIKDARYIPLFFKGYFTSEIEIPRGMLRPLLLLSYSFNYLFSGIQPLGYHIINVLFHFLNGVLCYCLLRFLMPHLPFGLSLLLSLLFISHPLNAQAVTYLSGRADLMSFLFITSGILAYIKGRFCLAFLSYALGLFSKETVLVFPLLVFSLHFLHPINMLNSKPRFLQKGKILFFLGIIGFTIFYWFYRQILLGQSVSILAPLNSPVRSFYSNILTQSAVSLFYLRLFFWPAPLTIHHNFPILSSLAEPLAFFSIIIFTVSISLIFLLRKRHPLFCLGLGWYLICLLPKFYASLHIVAAEHHFYLPSFGIYLILAVLLKNLYLRFRRKFIIVSVGIIGIFTILVWFKNYEYTNEFIFWRKSLDADRSSPIARYNLGMTYVQKGLYAEAEAEFRKTLYLAPAYASRVVKMVNENLANVYRLQRKFTQALDEINKNIQAGIQDFGTYQSLGVIYLDMKNEKKAQESWETGLALNPRSPGILYNLGLLSLRRSEFTKAKQYFQEAVNFNPEFYGAYFSLGKCLEEDGAIDAAIKAYEKTLSIEPKFVDAHYRLGTLYAKKTDLRALDEFKETIKLFPNFAAAHNNLAVIYASMNPPQLKLARDHAQKALSLGHDVNKNFLKIIGLEENKEGKKD